MKNYPLCILLLRGKIMRLRIGKLLVEAPECAACRKGYVFF